MKLKPIFIAIFFICAIFSLANVSAQDSNNLNSSEIQDTDNIETFTLNGENTVNYNENYINNRPSTNSNDEYVDTPNNMNLSINVETIQSDNTTIKVNFEGKLLCGESYFKNQSIYVFEIIN